jgi:hypothetical protein
VNIDQFIEAARDAWPHNAWIKQPDFRHLYVRLSKRLLENQMIETIDLLTIEAQEPGNGAFTSLVAHLRKTYPKSAIFVENVLNDRFASKLLELGFKSHPTLSRCCYVMPE